MSIRELMYGLILLSIIGMGMSAFYGGLFTSVEGVTDIDTDTIKEMNYTRVASNVTSQIEDIRDVLSVRKVNIVGFEVPYVDIISGGYMILLMLLNVPNILVSLITDMSVALPYGEWDWAVNLLITLAFIFIIFEVISAIFRRKL